MNILLVCASGMSTSMLVTKMKAEANARGFNDWDIFACAAEELEHVIDKYDVVLIGPQLRYREKSINELASSKNKGCAVIDALSYGRMDGKKVLDQAIALKK